MAFEQPGFKIGFLKAAADYTTKQFYGMKKTSTAGAATLISAAGELAIGVLQNKPIAGEACEITCGGVTKAICGGAIAEGDYVAFDAAGKLKVAVKGKTDTSDSGAAADPLVGSNVFGQALEAASADGDIIAILILQLGAVPTTAA